MTLKTTEPLSKGSLISLKLHIHTPKRRIRIIVTAHTFEINWGDKSVSSREVHDYIRSGIYLVQVKGTHLSKLKFIDCECIEAKIINCPELVSIDCHKNPLELLSIRNCKSLLYLHCAYCLLKTLDTSDLPSLRWLNCSGNRLNKLNISGLSDLVVLDAAHNRLKHLNLKGCENIVSLNVDNNLFSALDLNDIFACLTIQPPESNAYISFTNNPGESACDTSVVEIKSWHIGNITDPITNTETEETYTSHPQRFLVANSSSPESIIRLSFLIEGMTNIVIKADAKNILYVWSPGEISTQSVGSCRFVPFGTSDRKEVYIFADQLNSLCIEDAPCLELQIKSPTLKALGINNTLIKKLDLSHAPGLVCLECTGNPLKQLDLTPCKNINVVTCSNNRLQTIKAEGLENMQYIDCSGNQLKTLNLSGCQHLRTAALESNRLTKLSMENCRELRFLHCDNNCIDGELEEIFHQLPVNTSLFSFLENGDQVAGCITFSNNPGIRPEHQNLLKEKKWINAHDVISH